MTTNYKVNTNGQIVDLVEIFKPYTTGTKAQPTNYIVENYNNTGSNLDLSDIFAPYIEGQPMVPQTNYLVNVGGEMKDLNTIFAQVNTDLYIATGSYTVSSNLTYNTILTYIGAGTFELLENIPVDLLIVGGGGSGGNRTGPYFTVYNNGGGGGGGQVSFIQNQNLTPNSVFNISIGTFGNRNNETQGYGGSTIISNGITTFSSVGGNPGQDGPSPPDAYLKQAMGGTSGGNSGDGGMGGCSVNFSSFVNPTPGDNGTNYSTIDTIFYGAGGGGGGFSSVFNGGNTGGGGTYFWITTSLNASANTGSGGGGGMNGVAPGNGGTGILKILFNQ